MSTRGCPLVSVVVPFRSREEHIETCIRGLLAQDYPADRLELIFVDNASTDGSSDIVRRFQSVILITEPTVGAYAARNTGARRARGDVIAFTDSDCVADRAWVRRLAEALEDHTTQVAVGAVGPAGTGRVLGLLAAYERSKEEFILGSRDPTLYRGDGASLAVRRAAWDEHGPFALRRRGSDVLFVRTVVDALSCSAVRYHARARVTDLEVRSVRDYFAKAFVYGRSRRRYSRVRYSRALTSRERILTFVRTVKRRGLSSPEAVVLMLALAGGWTFWTVGDVVGAGENLLARG